MQPDCVAVAFADRREMSLMKMLPAVKKAISHPEIIVINLGKRGLMNWMDDDAYIKLLYLFSFGKIPDLENPKTFNEKLQWLKLHDRRPEYTRMVDKYEAKKYVSEKLGSEENIIPTLGVWDRFEDIDFGMLPDRYVLKCTHDSGSIVICRDKKMLDREIAKKKLSISLQRNFYYLGREWPYKRVKPRIIAEKYMTDESGAEPKDYKVFVFHGDARFVEVDFDRFMDHKRNFYSMEWKYLPFALQYPTEPSRQIPKPAILKELQEMAEYLARELGKPAFLRVDMYVIGLKLYFGEFTFYHESGMGHFTPKEWDRKLGSLIVLPHEATGK